MRFHRWAYLLLVLVLVSLFSSAFSLPSSMVGHFIPVGSVEEEPASFSQLLIRQAVIRSAWQAENISFLRARYAVANAASSEISSYREQLGLQRSNLMHVHLNGIILDSQKSDFLVREFPTMLVRLRLLHQHARDRGRPLSSFESRFASLQRGIASLDASQSELEKELTRISRTDAESRDAIEAVQIQSRRQLSLVSSWLTEYRAFLREVLSLE